MKTPTILAAIAGAVAVVFGLYIVATEEVREAEAPDIGEDPAAVSVSTADAETGGNAKEG